MQKSIQDEETDGRRLRSERSRLAIIQAVVDLAEEGILVPTAQQISERAGIGIRSFFRHFEDMEELFRVADEHIRDSYEAHFIGGNRAGTLEERIACVVERRSRAFEKVKNMLLGTQAQLWRYEVLRKNYARTQHGLSRNLEKWLPEITSLSREKREALDAVSSFEMWHRLREHQGLSRKIAIRIVISLITGLIQDD